jgi:hypothetical protein
MIPSKLHTKSYYEGWYALQNASITEVQTLCLVAFAWTFAVVVLELQSSRLALPPRAANMPPPYTASKLELVIFLPHPSPNG